MSLENRLGGLHSASKRSIILKATFMCIGSSRDVVPASNGFHECGHIQEARESLTKPPMFGGFVTLAWNSQSFVRVVEDDPKPDAPTVQGRRSIVGLLNVCRLDQQLHPTLSRLPNAEDDYVLHRIAL